MSSFEPKPFGKYLLTERIAVGGMAEIYRAKTFGVDGFEKLVAIKKILPNYSADQEFIAMLTDEAKLVVRLSHTNIVQIYDLGRVGEDYYISMEFIDGVNLREVINKTREKGKKLTLPLALYIISEVCKGLDYAHSKNDATGKPLQIVHRDISPQNILLSYEGEPKIVDFGIAKAALNVSQTSVGVLKGKVTYMSPEQALGKPVDGRTDIFSAGIILYELVSGKRLFTGETQLEVLKKIRDTQITETELTQDIPKELRPILAKALAYNVGDRYQTAGDFQIALTKLLYSQYHDFSPRDLAHFMKKIFSEELKKRAALHQEEASLNTLTKEVSLTEENQKSLVKIQTGSEIHPVLQAPTTPDESFRPEAFRGPTEPTASEAINLSPSPKKKKTLFTILAALFIIVLISLGAYAIIKWVNPKPAPTPSEPKKEEPKEIPVITPTELPEKTPEGTGATEEPKEPVETPKEEIKGKLEINSNPEGASIFINGEDTKKTTPATIEDLGFESTYEITLKLSKHEEVSQMISISKDSPNKTISFSLIKLEEKATVIVIPNVPDADISIDGKNVGKAPGTFEVKPGSHEIVISKEGYVSQKTKVEVVDDEKKEISLILEKIPPPAPAKEPVKEAPKETPKETPKTPTKETVKETGDTITQGTGALRIDSEPRGASVTVNGQKQGTTPVLLNLPAGKSYSITLSFPGYKTWQRTVNLNKKKIEVKANLAKQ